VIAFLDVLIVVVVLAWLVFGMRRFLDWLDR